MDSAVLEVGVILAKTEKQKALKEKDKKETTGKVLYLKYPFGTKIGMQMIKS